MREMRPLSLCLCAVLLAPAAGADVVRLLNGDRVSGRLVGKSTRRVRVQTPYGLLVIPRERVESIEHDDGSVEQVAAPQAQPTPAVVLPPQPARLQMVIRGDSFWQAWDPKSAPADPSLRLELRLDDRPLVTYTDVNLDQVNGQNRVAQAQPFLPTDVNQYGMNIRRSTGLPLLLVSLYSPDDAYDALFLANYGTIHVNDTLYRVPGVGQVLVFGAGDYAMRIWVKPDLLAKLELEKGRDVVDAALEGAQLRLRPILMTSFAFILGCVPLWLASGSGAIARRILGTVVISGMLAATLVAIFLIPVLFVVVERIAGRRRSGDGDPPRDAEA